jgi:hypothetical protein
MVMKMEAYGIREMKAIIKHFIGQHPVYSSVINGTMDEDEIVT